MRAQVGRETARVAALAAAVFASQCRAAVEPIETLTGLVERQRGARADAARRRFLLARAWERFRAWPFPAAALPVPAGELVGDQREEMIGRRPVDLLAVQRPRGCGLARQVSDEDAEAAPRQLPGRYFREPRREVLLEVRFDGVPVRFEERDEVRDFPTVVPRCAA